jgi:hypothetical protein
MKWTPIVNAIYSTNSTGKLVTNNISQQPLQLRYNEITEQYLKKAPKLTLNAFKPMTFWFKNGVHVTSS